MLSHTFTYADRSSNRPDIDIYSFCSAKDYLCELLLVWSLDWALECVLQLFFLFTPLAFRLLISLNVYFFPRSPLHYLSFTFFICPFPIRFICTLSVLSFRYLLSYSLCAFCVCGGREAAFRRCSGLCFCMASANVFTRSSIHFYLSHCVVCCFWVLTCTVLAACKKHFA